MSIHVFSSMNKIMHADKFVHTLITIKAPTINIQIKKYIELDVWSTVWQNLRHLSSLVGLLDSHCCQVTV